MGIGQKVYVRLQKQYCEFEQIKFTPSDWYPNDWELLIELGKQNVYCKEIAKKLSRNVKQVCTLLRKVGIKPVTKNPSAYYNFTSKIEIIVSQWLLEEGYKIKQQFPLGNFFFDFHIENTNILIEVNGDYWHCNPVIYKNGPINDTQKRLLRRDYCKKSFAKKLGYKQVVIWENDIINNSEIVKHKFLTEIRELNERINDKKIV